jgi:hypothetical protein
MLVPKRGSAQNSGMLERLARRSFEFGMVARRATYVAVLRAGEIGIKS